MTAKIQTVIRYALGAVLLASALGKGLDLGSFELEIKTLLLPLAALISPDKPSTQTLLNQLTPYFSLTAIALVVLELILGTMLILDVYRKPVSLFAAILFALFGAILAANVFDPNPTFKTCGCFGKLWEESLDGWSLVRNALLISASLFLYFSSIKPSMPQSSPTV
jgi:uncharacterized membrane protein YphA (DoxX/SURF4 family)